MDRGLIRFGAFIVTFNRPEILLASVESLRRQTFCPDHILIIDNSDQKDARSICEALDRRMVSYHHMGYNAGPAGAAYFGLKWFKEHGFEWACWGDDDNPPGIENTFERIFRMIKNMDANIGIAGAVGQRFDFSTGKVVRLKDEMLTGYLDVDVMAGASSMVINLKAMNESTLPDPQLFFGFEEFEFCLKLKRAGFRLVVDGDLMKDNRIKYNRLDLQFDRKIIPDLKTLWRQYYSTRNLIYIFFKLYPKYKHIAFYRMIAAAGKIVFGFGNGVTAGIRNARYQMAAVRDGVTGRLGIKVFN